MKRIVSLSLALLLLCTLCSCQKADNQPSETYALYVDGMLTGTMETEEEIQAVLDGLMENYAAPDDTKQELSFVQEIEIVPGQYPESSLLTADQLTEKLTQTVGEETIYTVKKGDTFSGIAECHNMTTSQLQECNPDYDSKNIRDGDQLTVLTSHPLLQVKTVKTITYEETIYHKTITKYRDDKPTSYSKVITEGVDGKKTVEAEQVYVDGVLVETVVLNETITKEAVTEEREVGTKKEANSHDQTIQQGDGIATGNWTWPVPVCHRVYQGYQSGHLAIDISNGETPVLGTPCLAADGGKVTYAGWYYSYGWYVKIEHGNGLVTTYGHLQSIAVKAGQQVSNGQEIGKVGNSGNAYGPHLHFEVYKNGVRVNPLDYVTP